MASVASTPSRTAERSTGGRRRARTRCTEFNAKYQSLGAEQSPLGYPTTDGRPCPDGRGRFNHFQGGSIHWTPATGAHEAHGAIREKWSELGWEGSFLGYPTSDETPDSYGTGRLNHFQGGLIYWSPQTGAHEVHGAILEK